MNSAKYFLPYASFSRKNLKGIIMLKERIRRIKLMIIIIFVRKIRYNF